MNPDERLAALSESYLRLQRAARDVCDAADRAASGEDVRELFGARVRILSREIQSVPQPNGLWWMGSS